MKITPILFLVEKLPANVRGPLDESDLPVDMREPLDPLRLALAPGGAPSPLPPLNFLGALLAILTCLSPSSST